MNRKRLAWALAVMAVFSLLLGQTAFAAGEKCGGYAAIEPPAGLKLETKTDTSADIRWSAPRNARGIEGYNVYRDGALVGATDKATLTFTDANLTPNTVNTWTVRSFGAMNALSAPSNRLTAATPIIIREAVVWSADTAPATINGGLIVEQSGRLSVNAGVTLKIKPCQRVVVRGTVNALGTADAPVVFTAADKACGGIAYWDTIEVAEGGTFSGESIKITYGDTLATVRGKLTLTNSEVAYAKTMGILVDKGGEFNGTGDSIHDCCSTAKCRGIDTAGVVNLTQCEIYDCPGIGMLVEPSGELSCANVTVRNCERGVEIRGAINFVLCGVTRCKYGLYFNTQSATNPIILNTFMGNNTYGVYNANPDAMTVDASMNYWGSPDGPSVFDDATQTWSQAGDRVSKGVIYDNWLTEPIA